MPRGVKIQEWRGPEKQAKLVWQLVYGEPWPKGWTVKWGAGMGRRMGLTRYFSQTILLSYDHAQRGVAGGVIDTLIHEFVHVRCRTLRHGKEFNRLVQWGITQLYRPDLLQQEAAKHE